MFLNNFPLAKFQLTISPIDKIILPKYKGSTFRGGFGHAFKKVVCVSFHKDCSECLLKEKCIYSYVFETPIPKDTTIMRKYPYAPHPFVIEPPLNEKTEFDKNDDLDFGLTLIGRAIDYLPYFIFTFDELGRIGLGKGRGKYLLKEVKNIIKNNDTVEEFVIYKGNDKILNNKYKILSSKDIINQTKKFSKKERIELQFITPTRIKYKNKLISELEFHILIRNLLRRISLLSYFHCNEELNINFKDVIEKSKEIIKEDSNLTWYDWERYSYRQEERMSLGGFIGNVTFKGNIKDYLPLILLGQYTHVGKGTSFGLGKYKIINKRSKELADYNKNINTFMDRWSR